MERDRIVVIPLKPALKNKDITYLMAEKPLYGTGSTQLEFPSGVKGTEESLEDASRRIFLQETGYDSSWVKFLYRFYPNPQGSNYSVSVFLGLALGESESAHAIVKLSGDDILNRIAENDIVDGNSLAAFSAVLLQSNEAKKYLNSEFEEPNSANSDSKKEAQNEEI